jgi:hypothetical protein
MNVMRGSAVMDAMNAVGDTVLILVHFNQAAKKKPCV